MMHVKWLMFNSDINVRAIFGVEATVTTMMSVWLLGDFFLLGDLCKVALDCFIAGLRKISWALSAESAPENEKLVHNCIKLVRRLYRKATHNVFEAFKPNTLSFLVSGIHLFAKSREFMDLLYEEPAFCSDWALAVTNSIGTTKVPPRSSDRCAKCKTLGHARLNHEKWFKEQEIEYFCEKCFLLQPLENWNGKGGAMPEVSDDGLPS
jgi:hypothetical protein